MSVFARAALRRSLAAVALAVPFAFAGGVGADDALAAGVSLKLLNATNGQVIGPLVDGQNLDLAALPSRELDVEAIAANTATKSVKFCLDGVCRFENTAPYTLDNTGDSTKWTPSTGAHTLTAVAYGAANATGTVLGDTTVKFTVGTPVPAGTMLWQPALTSLVPSFDDTPWNVYGGGSVSVLSDPVKGRVFRSYGAANMSKDGSQRAEQVPPVKLVNGQTVWLGFDLWANPGLPVSRTWASVMQLKTGGAQDGAPPISMDINAHGHAGLDIGSARIANTEPVHQLGGAPLGTWTRLVVGIHVNTDPTKAWVEVIRDGKTVLAREPWRTLNYSAYGSTVGGTMFPNGSTTSYLKFGVYRGPQAFNMDLRYANFKLATTRELAQ